MAMPGELRGVRHDCAAPAGSGSPGVAAVDARASPSSLPLGRLDRRRPRGAQAGLERGCAPLLPERILGDVGHQHLPPRYTAAAQEPLRMSTGECSSTARSFSGSRGATRWRKCRPSCGQHADRADRADADRLDQAGDRGEHFRQRRIAGELLEDRTLGAGADALGRASDLPRARRLRLRRPHPPSGASTARCRVALVDRASNWELTSRNSTPRSGISSPARRGTSFRMSPNLRVQLRAVAESGV